MSQHPDQDEGNSPRRRGYWPGRSDLVVIFAAGLAAYLIASVPASRSPPPPDSRIVVAVPRGASESKQQVCDRIELPQSLCALSKEGPNGVEIVLRSEAE